MTLVHTYYTPFLLYIYDTLLCVLYGRQYTLLVSVCVCVVKLERTKSENG